jgi:hypothetical protein
LPNAICVLFNHLDLDLVNMLSKIHWAALFAVIGSLLLSSSTNAALIVASWTFDGAANATTQSSSSTLYLANSGLQSTATLQGLYGGATTMTWPAVANASAGEWFLGGTGFNTAGGSYYQITFSTLNLENVNLSWDMLRTSNQSGSSTPQQFRVQYSTNGVDFPELTNAQGGLIDLDAPSETLTSYTVYLSVITPDLFSDVSKLVFYLVYH